MKKATRIKSFVLAMLMLISIVSSVNLTTFAAITVKPETTTASAQLKTPSISVYSYG